LLSRSSRNSATERDWTRGLGLAIVERMARLLGHRIEVRSRPGQGSMFAVEVPLGGPCAAAEPPPPPDAAALTGALVVAIDDDPVQLAALGVLFRRWGCEVVAAASAAEALARLSEAGRPPDAIVADYRLRGGPRASDRALRQARRGRARQS
jgi:hypothetical protein